MLLRELRHDNIVRLDRCGRGKRGATVHQRTTGQIRHIGQIGQIGQVQRLDTGTLDIGHLIRVFRDFGIGPGSWASFLPSCDRASDVAELI
jgi:hypothetical protein